MTPAAARIPSSLRIKTSKTPTYISLPDAMFMVAGLHAFMDNTGAIPLLFNAKKNTEILRNTAKKRSVSVSEFDKSYRNELAANEMGKCCLSRGTFVYWELTDGKQRLRSVVGIKHK
jgi:hypothetical protein